MAHDREEARHLGFGYPLHFASSSLTSYSTERRIRRHTAGALVGWWLLLLRTAFRPASGRDGRRARQCTAIGVVVAAATFAGCGAHQRSASRSAARPLTIRTLRAEVVRVGTIRNEILYGLRLRAFVCSRSNAEADRTVPISFRIAHFVLPRRALSGWKKPFRVVANDLHWLVTLGETRGMCGDVDFEDVIEPRNYAGLESDLGVLGYSTTVRCYGVQLTVHAVLGTGHRTNPVSVTKRAIVQCGRFGPR